MDGLHFIWPADPPRDRTAFDRISLALVAPPPYTGNNALTRHLQRALMGPVEHLTMLGHVNRERGVAFNCFAYYADDPEAVASCSMRDDVYLASIGAPFVWRLVKICDRLGPALARRPRVPKRPEAPGRLTPDPELAGLLDGTIDVSEAEAVRIAGAWPDAATLSADIELGEYALFYDLIRLVWLHEWAHALCGHVAASAGALQLTQLPEFSKARAENVPLGATGYSRLEILQALEMHADEFATRYCVQQLLWGVDPIGQLAGPKVDLIDRLLIFNVACCVFAVVWALAEQRYSPGMSFYPPALPLTSNEPDPLFTVIKASHPPAALRYLRFRDFQRDLAAQYGGGGSHLSPMVDAVSFGFIDTLGQANPHFFDLQNKTPMLVKTPTHKRLIAYETHLLGLDPILSPLLVRGGFVPTRQPSPGG